MKDGTNVSSSPITLIAELWIYADRIESDAFNGPFPDIWLHKACKMRVLSDILLTQIGGTSVDRTREIQNILVAEIAVRRRSGVERV